MCHILAWFAYRRARGHSLAMLAALLLLASSLPQDGAPRLSEAVTALSAARQSLGDTEFGRRAEALAEAGDASAAERVGEWM
jgi:hypothetical protein